MYRHICVPIDNSDWSNRAIDLAVELGKAFKAKLTGCHVYPAGLHGYRFKQMEYTLPDEYKDETELERQRQIHDSLIALGLRLISDCYLDVMARKVTAAGLEFERRTFDGRHYRVLVQHVEESRYDLVVMGALGMGAVKDSQLGSVTERFARKVSGDTLVVRTLDPVPESQGAIAVGLDGDPQSFYGLKVGLALGRALHRPVEAVTVSDPSRPPAILDAIAGVPPSHLEIGRSLAQAGGVDLRTMSLSGKCFEQLLRYCREERPWILVLGRRGIHSDETETGLGSNAAHVLRLAPTNVLLTGGKFHPPQSRKDWPPHRS